MMAAFLASCGGPYTARRVNLPDEKLRIADGYFEKGRYSSAAVEYKDFLAVFAGDERGDYAQFRLAESYRMNEEYALAAVEYRILINDYSYSEYVDDAFFLEAVCSWEMTRRAERDQTRTFEALSRVRRFLRFFPESPRREEAEKLLAEIHDRLGRKDFISAELYFGKGHLRAAEIYFRKIVEEYPETIWAGRSWYYLGSIYEERGEKEEAAESYGRAVRFEAEFEEKDRASRRLGELSRESRSG